MTKFEPREKFNNIRYNLEDDNYCTYKKPIDDKNENSQFPEVYNVVYSSYIMHYN